jgi:hypothetical protein
MDRAKRLNGVCKVSDQGWKTKESVFDFRQRREFFFSVLQRVQGGYGSFKTVVWWKWFLRGVKRLGRDAAHLRRCIDRVKGCVA